MEKIGFVNSIEVLKNNPIINKIELSKKQMSLVRRYSLDYPSYKFISTEQVLEICKKYRFACGRIDSYLGFVPEKNLQEIEDFRLTGRESNSLCCTTTPYFGLPKEEMEDFFFIEGAEIRKCDSYYHIFEKTEENSPFKDHSKDKAFQSLNGEDFYSNDSLNLFGLKDKGNLKFSCTPITLRICASFEDMGIESKVKYTTFGRIPDPVVLQPVEGGFLIVTSWENETNDVS